MQQENSGQEIPTWPQGATAAVQDWFVISGTFKERQLHECVSDLQEYTESVIGYISRYIDDVTVVKTIERSANQKGRSTGKSGSLFTAGGPQCCVGNERYYSEEEPVPESETVCKQTEQPQHE